MLAPLGVATTAADRYTSTTPVAASSSCCDVKWFTGHVQQQCIQSAYMYLANCTSCHACNSSLFFWTNTAKYYSGRIHWCLHHLPTLPAQVVTSVMSTTMTNWLHSLLDKQYISCVSVISTAHMTVYICEVMGVGSVYCEMWFEGLFLCICIKCINCSLYPGAL